MIWALTSNAGSIIQYTSNYQKHPNLDIYWLFIFIFRYYRMQQEFQSWNANLLVFIDNISGYFVLGVVLAFVVIVCTFWLVPTDKILFPDHSIDTPSSNQVFFILFSIIYLIEIFWKCTEIYFLLKIMVLFKLILDNF